DGVTTSSAIFDQPGSVPSLPMTEFDAYTLDLLAASGVILGAPGVAMPSMSVGWMVILPMVPPMWERHSQEHRRHRRPWGRCPRSGPPHRWFSTSPRQRRLLSSQAQIRWRRR
ncbi:unnamed protein product, partial [Ectocarpus fasciculatus]